MPSRKAHNFTMKKYAFAIITLLACSCSKQPYIKNNIWLTPEKLAGSSGRTWHVIGLTEVFRVTNGGANIYDSVIEHSPDVKDQIYFSATGKIVMPDSLTKIMALDSISRWSLENSSTIVFSNSHINYDGLLWNYTDSSIGIPAIICMNCFIAQKSKTVKLYLSL